MATIMKNCVYLILALFLTSCGNRTPIITGIKVKPVTENGEFGVQMDSKFNVGGMSLPFLTLPINHPKKGYEIGELIMGGQDVSLKINLSEIAPLASGNGTLPNGTALPFVGSDEVVSIPIGGKGIFLYAAWTESDVVLGFSIPIKAFDGIGKNVGNINLLPVFNVEGVRGAAGTYFSREPGENGIALFADISGIFNRDQKQEMFLMSDGAFLQKESRSSKMEIYGEVPSRRKEARIGKDMDRLSRRRTKLTLQ